MSRPSLNSNLTRIVLLLIWSVAWVIAFFISFR